MNVIPLLFAGMALMTVAGCSSLSAVAPRTLTVEDIAGMTAQGVGAEVIKRHIEVTRSRFEISSDEIIRLKRAGVTDDVLTFMIDSGKRRESSTFEQNLAAEALYEQ